MGGLRTCCGYLCCCSLWSQCENSDQISNQMHLAVERNDADSLECWALKAESPTLACEAESIANQMQLAVDLRDLSGLKRWLKAVAKFELRLTKPNVSEVICSVMGSVASQPEVNDLLI